MTDVSDVTIRPFGPGDRGLVEAFFDQMGGETRAFFNENDGNRQWAMRFFDGDTTNIIRWLAEAGGRMVGYVFLWDTHTGVPWLGVAVAEDWKGKRLGRRLITHAHAHARRLGAGGVLLTTGFGNARAQALYARMGYERLGMHRNGEILMIHRFGPRDAST